MVTHEDAKEFYEDFSLLAGQRDWLKANRRHEQLKALIRDLLGARRGLLIADVGCGAGVLTDFLTRYGRVTGVDFSSAAIRAARVYAPAPTFLVGGVEALPDSGYDLIALFDVLEHIPHDERPRFLADLRAKLADDGLIFCSTPFPDATRVRREASDASLQIVDEQVQLPQVLAEAAGAGLQLVRFDAYDVFAGSPEYQAVVLTPTRSQGGAPVLRQPGFARRDRLTSHPLARRARRVRYAARALRRGDVGTAWWFLTAAVPHVDS